MPRDWWQDAARNRVLYGAGSGEQDTRNAAQNEAAAAAIAKAITAIQAAIAEVEQFTIACDTVALLGQSQAAIAQAVAALPPTPEEHEHV